MNKQTVAQLRKASLNLHEQAYTAAGLSKLLLDELMGAANGFNTRLTEEERTHIANSLYQLSNNMEDAAGKVAETLGDSR